MRNIIIKYLSTSTKDFKKIYKLGEGANCKVYNIMSLNDNKYYICKEYNNNAYHHIYEEEDNLKLIKTNNNILPKYYKSIIEDDKIWLLTEYIEGIDLFEKYINNKNNNILLNEKNIKPILKKMINCIEECNKNNLVHLDIKPENFVISYDDNISLIDFGCSKQFNDKNKLYELNSTRIGTYTYCSPEILYKNLYHINSDIWSLGITIYGLLSKEKLFSNLEINNPKKIYKYINHLTPRIARFIKTNFCKKSKRKIYLEQLKQHEWFNK